ncbi:uncharacterized protein AAES06_023653 [Glossophaga mutica]
MEALQRSAITDRESGKKFPDTTRSMNVYLGTRLMFEKAGLVDYNEVHVQILGSEETYGAQAKENLNRGPREVVLWLSVHHKEKRAVEIFREKLPQQGLEWVDIHLINGGHIETFPKDLTFTLDTLASPNLPKADDDLKDLQGSSLTYRLEALAYTRSGDKGNSANIGIIAWHLYYPYLTKFLTAQATEGFFQHILHKEQPEGNSVISSLVYYA